MANAPRTAQRTCYCGARMLTRSLSRWWHVTVEGLENLPETGPVILAANHVSFLDSPLMMFLLPRQVRFLGKADYLRSWTTRFVFPAIGHDPPRTRRAAQRAGAMRCRTRQSPSAARSSVCSPRAPGAVTATCTGATPDWPGSP